MMWYMKVAMMMLKRRWCSSIFSNHSIRSYYSKIDPEKFSELSDQLKAKAVEVLEEFKKEGEEIR